MVRPKYNNNWENEIFNQDYGLRPVQEYIEPEYEVVRKKTATKQFNEKPVSVDTQVIYPYQVRKTSGRKKIKVKKIFSFVFSLLLIFVVFPFVTKNFIRPVFNKHAKADKVDYYRIMLPTRQYLYNDIFMNKHILRDVNKINPKMKPIPEKREILALKMQLLGLMKQYSKISPAIYVWNYATGNYVDIDSDKIYASASIIKLPILLEMFRNIETDDISLNDKMEIKDYYRAEGSGNIKNALPGNTYTIDRLANLMITNSDNSATNMIMSKIGGKPVVNRAIKDWGLRNTYIENWLPDLEGTNKTTAKDLAVMLYNIDNAEFLNLQSREKIVEYMSNVKNNRLIAAGLPTNTMLIHKTGDIGSMLGDAGIVYDNNGQKYIIVILANRPYNDFAGKDFIVNATRIINDYML